MPELKMFNHRLTRNYNDLLISSQSVLDHCKQQEKEIKVRNFLNNLASVVFTILLVELDDVAQNDIQLNQTAVSGIYQHRWLIISWSIVEFRILDHIDHLSLFDNLVIFSIVVFAQVSVSNKLHLLHQRVDYFVDYVICVL